MIRCQAKASTCCVSVCLSTNLYMSPLWGDKTANFKNLRFMIVISVQVECKDKGIKQKRGYYLTKAIIHNKF